jgi:hypothetical protein
MNRGILALSVENDASSSANGVIDLNSSGLVSRWFFGMLRSRSVSVRESLCLRLLQFALLANAFFVSLVMSAVWTAIGIPAGFSLSFIVTQLGALETVVGDFLWHKG